MTKVILAAIIVLAHAPLAFPGTAQWTGKQMPVPASTGYTAKCEYTDGVVKFWRLTSGPCKPVVEATGGAIPPIDTKRKKDQRLPALKTYP